MLGSSIGNNLATHLASTQSTASIFRVEDGGCDSFHNTCEPYLVFIDLRQYVIIQIVVTSLKCVLQFGLSKYLTSYFDNRPIRFY